MNSPAFPIPARLNLLIAGLQVTALVALLYAAGRAGPGWALGGVAVAYSLVMNSAYAMMHEAEHNTLHPNPVINQGVGVILGLFFPAPFHLLRQGHISHHRRNRSDDEAFDLYLPGDRRLSKAIKFYGILTGFFWLLIVMGNLVVAISPALLRRGAGSFDRTGNKLFASLDPRYDWPIRIEALAGLGLHAGLCRLFAAPPLHYLALPAAFGILWSALQDVHHYDTGRDVQNGARNLRTFFLIDRLWLNHNWHLNHHRQPTVPWIHLPALSTPGEKRGTLLRAYLRMWRGPQYTAEKVENLYAGNITR